MRTVIQRLFLVLVASAAVVWLGGCGAEADEAEPDEPADEEPGLRPPALYELEYELAYDDGHCDCVLSPMSMLSGAEVAVRFTPERYPATLTAAQFYVPELGQPHAPFGVRVYDDDGVDGSPGTPLWLLASSGRRSGALPWVEVVPGKRMAQITEGDFYVAMVWLRPQGKDGMHAQFLGADRTRPGDRTWQRADAASAWQQGEQIGRRVRQQDAMIRVTLH